MTFFGESACIFLNTEKNWPTIPMSDRVDQFRIFIQVAEAGSFIGAARVLNLPPATVSMAIRKLEDELGTRLLHRTTRKVSLTDDGRKTLPIARKIAGDLDDFYELFKNHQNLLTGRLKVDVPSRLARRLVAPALPAFLEQHPSLELNLGSSDRFVDLIKEGIDCAIRVGEPRNDSLVVRSLGELEMVNCASPGYLSRHGVPKTPDELDKHWAVGYVISSEIQYPAMWDYRNAHGQARQVQMPYRVVVNNVENYLACCMASMGLIQVPRFDVKELLASGELVEVLKDWPAPPMPISALYLHRRQRTQRLVAFIEWFHSLLLENQ